MSPLNEAELELCDQLGITDAETLKLADRLDGYVSIEDGDMREVQA